MRHRTLIGTIGMLGLAALVGLFAALSSTFSPQDAAFAQSNNPPSFASEETTRTVDENTPWLQNIVGPVTATDGDDDPLTYSLENAGTSHFTIVSSTGQLQTGAPLNYEDQSVYTVKVIATDPSGASDKITVTINVNDLEEPGTVVLSWKQPQVGTALTATLTDPDGDISDLTWQWSRSSSKSATPTPMGTATSDRYTPVAADERKFLWATASYSDGNGSGKTAEAVSYRWVRPRPASNNAPTFPETNSTTYTCPEDIDTDYCLYVSRSAAVGTEIYNAARATDPDQYDEIRYSLEGADADSFGVVASTGYLITKTSQNNANTGPYKVTLKASDESGATDTVTVTIRLKGNRWNPSVIGPRRISYPENGTWRVAQYTASTPAGATNTWIITVEPGGGEGDFFDIDDDGVLTFRQPPDYKESGDNEYSFNVEAYDGNPPSGQRPGKTFYSVTVTVIDVEEANEQPAFADATTTRSIIENTEAGENVGDPVTATDPDRDALEYILGGTDASSFDIGSSTGQLLTDAALDHETKSSYSVTVSVRDSKDSDGNPDTTMDDSIEVTITVTNEDEDGTVTLAPPQPQVGTALTATLSDPDGTVSGTTWVWEISADGNTGWTPVGGATSTVTTSSYTPVDADLGKYLRATATYTDAEGSGKNAEAVSGNPVQARPVTNSAPEFPAPTTTREVAEDTVAGGNVGAPVTATDTGDTLTYGLEGADATAFEIDSTSGQIEVATGTTLDYDTKSSYSVTVSVRDSKDDFGDADTATDDTIDVAITVTNVDEEGAVTLAPPQPQVGTALTATLSDPDGTVSGTTWVWESSADGNTGWTAASGATSTVTTSSYTPVDADLGRYLRATAAYTDPQGSGKTADAVSDNQVQARPVTNSAPEFPAPTTTRAVDEDTVGGGNVGAPVTATDTDNGDTLTYGLEGDDAAAFEIDSTSGQIKLASGTTLDFETESSYSVVVSVRDSKDDYGAADTATDDTIDVTITVTNLDEHGTVTLAPAQPQVGTALTATLTDPDGTASGTTWVWESSADGNTGWTTVSGATSTVTASRYTPVSTDLDQYLRATATYTDPEGSGKSAEAVSDNAVQARPVTNVAPQFSDEATTRAVDEDTVAGGNVGAPVTATDSDNGDTLTYGLEGADAAAFEIDSTGGQIKVGTETMLDYETKSSYTVVVSVRDSKDDFGVSDSVTDDTITVTITVSGVDETPDVMGPDSIDYEENGEGEVAAYSAFDPETGSITWSWDGDDKDRFLPSANGSLAFRTPPDYEAPADNDGDNVYQVTLQASDGSNTGSLDVTVTVTNEDEDGTVTLSSDRPQTGTALTATLSDLDGTVSGTTWLWESSADGLTGWTAASGAVSTVTTSSYTPVTGDLGKYLRVTATYTDPEGTGKSADAMAANPTNSAPVFSSNTANRSVSEAAEIGDDVGTPVIATDADTLEYTLGGTDVDSFGIVTTSGQLQTKVALDYEEMSSYEVTVTATDPSGATATITVNITVINEDEAGTVGLSTVQPQVGTELTATLTDPDGDVSGVTWQWARGDGNDPWSNISTGAAYEPVAADVDKFLRATATYTDPQGASKSAYGISINPVQAAPSGTNVAPAFSAETASRSVPENALPGSNIGTPVTAVDTDTLTYTLGGADAGSFSIVDTSGQLQTITELDYETDNSYDVTVTATDPSDDADSIAVTITVINLDEAGTVTLAPDPPQVGTALTATLEDPDGNVSSVTWQWARGATATGTFTNISTVTSYTPVAADVGKYLQAAASYTDAEDSGKTAMKVSANLVQAAPLANNEPQFSGSTAARSVEENTPAGESIGDPVAATDMDNGDTLTYSLGGADADSFDIVTSSGQLQTKGALDYEDKQSYTVTVSVHDGKDANGAVDTAVDATITVTINLSNVEEPGTVTLSSAQPLTGTAFVASLTDPDGSVTSLTWQWASSATSGGGFGDITGTTSASYTPVAGDLGKYLQATATYTDGHDSNKSAVAVSAEPTNSAPVFSEATATRSVAEDASIGANVGAPVTATDADTLAYTLAGTDAASFSIVETSGQLQTETLLDYEARRSHEVTVTVTDSWGATDVITVIIEVTNVEEPGTVTLSTIQPQVGTEVTAELTDPDGDPTRVIWQWARAASPNGSWTNVSSGVDHASYTPVAADVGQYLRAWATYEDPQGGSKSANVVSDNPVQAAPAGNNSAPVFSENTAARSVSENTATETSFGTPVTASDANSDTLTYTLGGADADSFGIVAASGQLQTGDTLDYESRSSYQVTVTAADPSNASDTIPVTITVTNEDETGAVNLSTVQPQVGTAVTATLDDPDGVPPSITWQWARGETALGPFTNVSSGPNPAVYTPVTADLDHYLRATATYTDPHGSGKSAYVVSYNPVRAAPATNSTPVFTSETATRPVAENAAIGANVGTPVTAADAENDPLTYSLDGNTVPFEILQASGQLQTTAALDFEETASYIVTVIATDPSNKSDTITVTITVDNVDEDGTVTLSSLQPQVGTELTATLEDPDGDPSSVTWEWVSADSNVGSGDTYTPVTADVGNFLQATATYTDPQGSGKTATGVSANAVQVEPQTNSAPEFSADTAVRAVPENAAADRNIGAPLTATDPDNDTLTYSLGGTDAGSFRIVQATGQLQTKLPLDSEVKQTYTVVVTAVDPSGEFDTITVTINVTNVDEAPGVSGPTSLNYKENDIVAVGSYAATNPENGTIVWGKSGDDSDDFSISNTGELTFSTPPNFELPSDLNTDNVYHVTVEASDGTDTGSLAVTITVTNEDESGLLNLPSDQSQVDTELRALLADFDGTVSGETWKWESSSDGQTNWATISGAASSTYTPVVADVDKYLRVSVTYTDPHGPGKTADAVTADTVLAEPNSAPQFSDATVSRTVAENTIWGTDIGAPITATDTTGDTLTYSLDSDDGDSFSIIRMSGQLRTKDDLDYERKSSYSVTVTVTDSASAVAEVPVTITVTNVEEAGEVTLSSVQPQVGTALTATLTDPDVVSGSPTWRWKIASSATGTFNNVSGGTSATYTPLAGDVGKYLKVTASYDDGEGSGKSAYLAAANPVRVAPGSNAAPVFPSNENGARSVAENTRAGRNIGAPVDATDPNVNDTLTYSKSGADAAFFNIVSTSGQLRTKDPLNYENKSSYSFTVTAADPSGLTAAKSVTVTVTDVNEPPGKPAVPTVGPASTSGHAALSVSWNAPSNRGSAITAYDVEYRKNGTVNWLDSNVLVSGTGATISSVTPDSNYQAKVRAKSQEGTGTWSNPGNGRTAVTPVNLQATLTVNYQSASYSVTEGGSRSITVTLSEPADRVLSIPITVANGTAEYGDYQVTGLNNNTLSISPGDSNRSFTFRALHESDRSNETVTLGFGNLPNKVTAGARNTATVRITDDDLLVRISNDDDDDSDDDDQDEKSEIDPLSNIVDSGTSGNRAPVFVEGVSTRRTVPEHAKRAVYIGSPVIATDPDGDVLTYSLGDVFDGESFVVDSAWGQLMTNSLLDFETKSSYTVVVGVTDGRGAGDTMVVTINLTDMQEVPINNPQTQAVGKVNPDAEVTIETPDGVASVTFSAGSRQSSYQVRVDSASSNCGSDIPEGALRAPLSVEFFDNWGRQEHDVVLDQPATITLRLNAAELGGVNQVLAAHRRGGFNVFARSDAGDEWSNVEFTLEADDQDTITLTVGGLYRLHCFAAATDAAAFGSVVRPAAESPAPTPRPTAQPTPGPTPTPTPTAVPAETRLPAATPNIVPDVSEEPEPNPPVINLIEEVSAASEPEAPDAPASPIREESVETPIWPILMMIAGVTMMATGGGLYLLARRRRKAEGRP